MPNPHSATVTDALGCVESVSFSLLEPDSLILTPTAIAVNCFGEINGSATVEVMGGEPDYAYEWDTGDDGSSIMICPPGCIGSLLQTISVARIPQRSE